MLSRLLVVMGASLLIYVGVDLLLDFPMRGSYAALVLIYAAGALCLISLGLIVASRLRTEELAEWHPQPDLLAHAPAVRGLVLHGGHQRRSPASCPNSRP